jgi:hypothetical protein
MDNFDPHISVDNISTSLHDPDYSIKEMSFDNLKHKIETPFKVLSGLNITKDVSDNYTSGIPNPIFENERYITRFSSWNKLKYLLNDAEKYDAKKGFNDFFKIKSTLWEPKSINTSLSVVFSRNPFRELKFDGKSVEAFSSDEYARLLDIIYGNSSALCMVPDIIRNAANNKTISIDKYLNIVDQSVDILSENSKIPTFAPLQLGLSRKELDTVLLHYKKQRYSNIWINFCAHPCDNMNTSNLRTIQRTIKKHFSGMDVVLYFSHIEKEINPNIHDKKVIASDILTQFNGADFIGVNRSTKRIPNKKIDWEEIAKVNNYDTVDEYKLANLLHKNRIIDPSSYYYCTLDAYPSDMSTEFDVLTREHTNKLINSVLLNSEINKVKTIVEESKPTNVKNTILKAKLDKKQDFKAASMQSRSLRRYLKEKQAINDNQTIKDLIVPTIVSTSFEDFDMYNKLGKL